MRETCQEETNEIPTVPDERSADISVPPPEQEHWKSTPSANDIELSSSDNGSRPPGIRPPAAAGLRKFGAIGLVLFFLFGKLKYLGLILQIGKFKTFFSMLISIWAYAMFWGWSFAAGFVVLIFIHEMGHVLALRMMGIRASAPMFIPFVGAHIVMQKMPKNAFAESVAAYGGPLLGTLGAIGCVGIGMATGNLFWYALASSGFLLNLFNLLPISPLDGGRIIGVISPKLWVLGLLGAVALFYLTWSPILALIVIMGSYQIYTSFKKSKTERTRYYNVSLGKRIAMGAAFLFLLAVTSFGMMAMHAPLQGL
jgi:Zn-dependent protease